MTAKDKAKDPLTIIIVSYNSSAVLTKCLSPLIDSEQHPVIIVDNASPDKSANTLHNRFPLAQIEHLNQNTGYGRAANIGLQQVNTPYALLLNPDLEASPDDVKKLLIQAQSDPGGTIWAPATRAQDFAKEPPRHASSVSGCAMLFDMNALKKIGFFDENIFLFFEETDLCRRALDAGYSVQLCPAIHFNHMQGQACPSNPAVEWMKNWHYGWSRCYYFHKHEPLNKKRFPKRQYAQYQKKFWIAVNSEKRRKYKAQALGAKAFLAGAKAFNADGRPQMIPS